jgi:hypothetical protein
MRMRFRTVSDTESACEDALLLKMIFRNAMTIVTPTSAKPATTVLDMREQSIARDVQCRAACTFEVAARHGADNAVPSETAIAAVELVATSVRNDLA